ncbi:hypothetical protein STEG23_013313, partial [Scotinomys teguina]
VMNKSESSILCRFCPGESEEFYRIFNVFHVRNILSYGYECCNKTPNQKQLGCGCFGSQGPHQWEVAQDLSEISTEMEDSFPLIKSAHTFSSDYKLWLVGIFRYLVIESYVVCSFNIFFLGRVEMRNVLQDFDPELKYYKKRFQELLDMPWSDSLVPYSYKADCNESQTGPSSCYGLSCNESTSPSPKGYLQLNEGHWKRKNDILYIE